MVPQLRDSNTQAICQHKPTTASARLHCVSMNTLDAYLLTRQWRDTADGVELSFWAASDSGPVNLVIQRQKAVCFVERRTQISLPAGVQRKAVNLNLLNAGAVDALYFRQQKQLQQLRQNGVPLCESDIKPTDRFLMERFIKTGIRIHGAPDHHSQHLSLINPRLQPCEFRPTLKTVSIDIETRGGSRTLYSIAAATLARENCAQGLQPPPTIADKNRSSVLDTNRATTPGSVVFMIGSGETEWRDHYELRYYPSETALLNAFFDWIAETDPDVLIGWAVVNFDLNFLDQKCRALGIAFRLGRNGETAAVLQPGNPGTPRIARVPGRAVLDGVDQLKAGFWAFDSFSLDNVSNQLLGTGKLIGSDKDKVAEINHLFKHDKPALADYNIKDCTLVNDIFNTANLLEFAQQRANLTGLALDRIGGSVAAFDNLYLPKLHRAGYVAPDVKTHDDSAGSPGGYVIDSIPGLYKNILVLDFKSLYPSIIRTFFIDPLGLTVSADDSVPGFVGANFSREHHILPGLIEELWAAREKAKQSGNGPLSQAIKIIMNSFYGVLGTTGCRFFSPQLASSITRRGHEIITRSRNWIESQGYDVIYGDTDSLFVWVGDEADAGHCKATGEQLMSGLNTWWQQELQSQYRLESYLDVEFETHYQRFFMPTVRGQSTGSKKRYAGLSATACTNDAESADTDSRLIIKGLEAARTDWTPLARTFQRELFLRIFTDKPFAQYVRRIAEQVINGELDDQLVYRKRIRRRLEEYKRNVPPHIQAAKKRQTHSNFIRYVITRNGPEPIDDLRSLLDYTHYLEKQLAPAADSILQFMDTSFSALTDAQLEMF